MRMRRKEMSRLEESSLDPSAVREGAQGASGCYSAILGKFDFVDLLHRKPSHILHQVKEPTCQMLPLQQMLKALRRRQARRVLPRTKNTIS